MADTPEPMPYWVDELYEKHECGPYGDYSEPKRIVLELGGRSITLISPHEIDRDEILPTSAAEAGDLLYLVARRASPRGYTPYFPILIVACRREAGVYTVVVWHELHGWALKYLGLGMPESP